MMLITSSIGTVGVTLAWRNYRLRRANVRGAAVCGGAVAACTFVCWLLSADHVASYWHEMTIVIVVLGVAAWLALLMAIAYLALEPAVRKRWPWRGVAWNRLLMGRWRDPLVGRSVLLGLAASLLLSALLRWPLVAVVALVGGLGMAWAAHRARP